MQHTGPKVASKRVARFKARAAELRRTARGAEKEERAVLLKQAEIFERIVKTAECDIQEPEQSEARGFPRSGQAI